MLVKVAEAEGATLDWLVAKCEGFIGADGKYTDEYCDSLRHDQDGGFSTEWAQGGPIIELERICLRDTGDEDDLMWEATDQRESTYFRGPTPLIAAMRCYVASKLGEEVEVPDGLS
jgi:hypothetical protein